jgi:tmRNA-binding protein
MESKNLASNKSAKRDFEILKSFEAGLSLLGPEVKSIRQGNISIRESYARIVNNEIFLFNCRGKINLTILNQRDQKNYYLTKKKFLF